MNYFGALSALLSLNEVMTGLPYLRNDPESPADSDRQESKRQDELAPFGQSEEGAIK